MYIQSTTPNSIYLTYVLTLPHHLTSTSRFSKLSLSFSCSHKNFSYLPHVPASPAQIIIMIHISPTSSSRNFFYPPVSSSLLGMNIPPSTLLSYTIYMFALLCTRTHTHTHTHIHAYTHTYIHTHIHAYTHTHTRIHTHSSQICSFFVP
jgi:hypothetical protein